jgi:hypothetical protein
MPSQAGTVGAGALDTDSMQLAVALQPLHEGAIASRRCRELTIAELAPKVIDHSGMVALSVRVHAASDTNRRPCHAGHALPLRFAAVRWAHAAVGIGGQASDGRLCAGSYEVTPPGRSRATTSSAGPTDRPKDSTSRQAYGESDPAEDAGVVGLVVLLDGVEAVVVAGVSWPAEGTAGGAEQHRHVAEALVGDVGDSQVGVSRGTAPKHSPGAW